MHKAPQGFGGNKDTFILRTSCGTWRNKYINNCGVSNEICTVTEIQEMQRGPEGALRI